MKRICWIIAGFVLLAGVSVIVVLLWPARREPVVYYDFFQRLPEAEIEDEGFLSFCWKEPLQGQWEEDRTADTRQYWSRPLEMPLEWDPEVLELYVGKRSWDKRFPARGPRSATWSIDFGQQRIRNIRHIASANCWSATERRLELGPAIVWFDIYWANPSRPAPVLEAFLNGEPARRLVTAPHRSRHFEWDISVREEVLRLELRAERSEAKFDPEDLWIRGGIAYPSRILLDFPAREKRLNPDELMLYYRPRHFQGLLPRAIWSGVLPERVPRNPGWLQTHVTVNDVCRPAFRLLPGQRVRFPIWMKGQSTLRLQWADQLSRPLLPSSTGHIELALITEASPPQVLLKAPIKKGLWNPAEAWKTKKLSLEDWTGVPFELELSFKVGRPDAVFYPEVDHLFDLPFALVSLAPLSTTEYRYPERPSIILMGSDTLRRDRLSCYGYRSPVRPERQITPCLDYLARFCTRYEWAYSAASFTLPSFASMLTSRYPSEHTAFVIFNPLPSTVETVTQTLNRQGYETAAFADQGFMDPHYGLYSGFEIYDNQGGRFEEIYPRALRWLDQRDKNRPFFLFLHYYNTHAPYWSPPEHRYRFHPNPGYNRIPRIATQVDNFWLRDVRIEQIPLEPEDYQHITALYDGSVSWLDENIRGFLTGMSQRGLFNSTLLIFTSDHGECLGEGGQLAHGETLREPLLRVPLLIKWPGGTRREELIRTPVTLLDLAPTMLDVAGIPVPEGYQGISLRCETPGEEPPRRVLYAQIPFQKKVAAIDHPYKLVLDISTQAPQPELFNVMKDVQETNNLAVAGDSTTERLLELIQEHLKDTPPLTALAQEAVIDPTVLDQLEQLGYTAK